MTKTELGTCKDTYLALRRAWWYGVVCSTGFHMLIQDWLGLEGYILFVREHWTNVHWVVGLVLTAGSMCLWIGMLTRFDWLNQEKEDGE